LLGGSPPAWSVPTVLPGSPAARVLAAATTNLGVGGTAFVFGGLAVSGGALLNDLWSFNGTTWTQLTPASSPSPRLGAALANDGFGGLFLGGGVDATGVLIDLWQFSGGSWTPGRRIPR